MQPWLFSATFLIAVAGVILTPAATQAADAAPLRVIPHPQTLELGDGAMELKGASRIVAADKTLVPLAKLLAEEIFLLTGRKTASTSGKPKPGDIVLELAASLQGEAYGLEIDAMATVRGGNHGAVALGTATLLQLIQTDKSTVSLPRLAIQDEPAIAFRSVMLDLARRWHPLETIHETVNLLRLLKIRYLHLHLSDNESCTFTSRAFPKLATPDRSYSVEQLRELVRYADQRGVTIIPEIDIPGHAGSWVGRVPEVFGTIDAQSGQAKSTGVVNMASERAYQGLDTLIGELCDVFSSSPYIHIGADEVWAPHLKDVAEYKEYTERHGLKLAAEGDVGELFSHFIARMNEIVRKRNRQTIVWSGFPHEGTANVKIPKDIVIMAWNAGPKAFVAAGFPVVNCCWVPLYMVPPQGRAPTAEMIFDWNPRKFDAWEWNEPIQLADDEPVLGAQICFWEQRYNEVWPILRERTPAFAERLWSAESDKDYEQFRARQSHVDSVLQRIVQPVRIEATGPIEPRDVSFTDKLTIKLTGALPGTKIRYTLSTPWEQFPTATSNVYSRPISLNETTTVSARLFTAQGQPLGGVTQQRFRKIEPCYEYRVLGPTPKQGWPMMPDFTQLKELHSGVTGRLTHDRAEQINRSMFAGLPEFGHIDVRIHGLYNPYALELKGTFHVAAEGDYKFRVKARDGMVRLVFGDHVLESDAAEDKTVSLRSGDHPFTIEYFYRKHVNDLNIQVQVPGSDKFESFETLVKPLSVK